MRSTVNAAINIMAMALSGPSRSRYRVPAPARAGQMRAAARLAQSRDPRPSGTFVSEQDARRALRRLDRAERRAARLGISAPLPSHISRNGSEAIRIIRAVEAQRARQAEAADQLTADRSGAEEAPKAKRSHKKKVAA